MYNLIKNEVVKILKRTRTKFFLVFILLSILLQGVYSYHFKEESNQNWKQELITKNQDLQLDIQNSKGLIDEKTQASLQQQIELNQYAIENDIPINKKTAWNFSEDASHQILLATIFTIIIAADIVASEFSWGTINFLLIRPISRTKILLSKYLTTLVFSVGFMAIILFFSLMFGGVFFGFKGVFQPYIYIDANHFIHKNTMFHQLFIDYGLQTITMITIVTIAYAISTAFKSNSVSIVVSILSLFLGNILAIPVSQLSWSKYIIFTNLDLIKYTDGTNQIPGMTILFSFSVISIYFIVFHIFAWYMFVKRDVA